MAAVSRPAIASIVVTVVVGTSAAIVVNLFTDKPDVALGSVVAVIVATQACVMYVGEVLRQREAGIDRGVLISSFAALVPFSRKSRSRNESLRVIRADIEAKRRVRLRPLVPDERLEDVLAWMRRVADPLVEVPAGRLRVLVAQMGAGKTERAMRWIEQGIDNADADAYIEVPIWLNAREITQGLQASIHLSLGRDPYHPCRVAIDDLDSVGLNEADRILDDARQLVSVWPNLSILVTSRPGANVSDKETLAIEPWEPRRGMDLAQVVLGHDLPHGVWSRETAALFTAPLLALAMAKRIRAGGSSPASRIELLAGIVSDVLGGERPERASVEVWKSLARLAGLTLNSGAAVRSVKMGSEVEVWALTDTKLVVEERGYLKFALPMFEQHFAAQALRDGVFSIEAASGPDAFPRWRYAIALSFSALEPSVAEPMFATLASKNAAAASWILDELASRPDASIFPIDVEPDRVRHGDDVLLTVRVGSRSITAGTWLREAIEAFLAGFGPIATKLAAHKDGRLVQWGFSLKDNYAILATADETLPPPAVVEVHGDFNEISFADGWRSIHGFDFPDYEYGRWIWAREQLRESLGLLLKRRKIPTNTGTALDRERLWSMATAVARVGPNKRIDPTDVEGLRSRVAEMMAQVEESHWTTWSTSGYSFDSDDIRWIQSRLTSVADGYLSPSWPKPDIVSSESKRWYWQRYSPELMREVSARIVSEAISGYKDIVELNFPQLGDALGLYSIRPIRFDGVLVIPKGVDQHAPWMVYTLSNDEDPASPIAPTVNLSLSDDTEMAAELGAMRRRALTHESVFYTLSRSGTAWSVGKSYAATNLAYKWLVRDLEALGLLKKHFRFD